MNAEFVKTDTMNESGEKVNLTDDLMISAIVTDIFPFLFCTKGGRISLMSTFLSFDVIRIFSKA